MLWGARSSFSHPPPAPCSLNHTHLWGGSEAACRRRTLSAALPDRGTSLWWTCCSLQSPACCIAPVASSSAHCPLHSPPGPAEMPVHRQAQALNVIYLDGDMFKTPSTQANTIFTPPFSFDTFHEYLCKDGLIAKTHWAVVYIQGQCVALVLHKKKWSASRLMRFRKDCFVWTGP